MKKLIVCRKEARVIQNSENFTFVRKVYPRGGSLKEAVSKAYPVGARFWVAEPVFSATDQAGEYFRMFDADPLPEGFTRKTLGRPGYRIFQVESRNVVEVVSVGDSINQQKWEDVARVDVTFKKVVK